MTTRHATTRHAATTLVPVAAAQRAPRPVRTLPDASPDASPNALLDGRRDALLAHGFGIDGQPAERADDTRPYTEELHGVTSGLDTGDGSSAPSQDDGNTDRHASAVADTIVDCPRCTRPVPPATDHDRVTRCVWPAPAGVAAVLVWLRLDAHHGQVLIQEPTAADDTDRDQQDPLPDGLHLGLDL
jgi:hypothetical protein